MEEEVNITEIIINAINSIFNNIFSSIDNNLYSILDNITFINDDILSSSSFNSIFGSSGSNGILLIANAFIFGFLLYYCIKLILSHLFITQTERPTSFIFKLLFFSICMNSSLFICEQILNLVFSVSNSICILGQDLFSVNISFSSLVDRLNQIIVIEENSFTIFSIDGLLKSIISISFLNLAFSYSVRYILIKVFILISPFAFLCLSLPSTSNFFKAWLKCFLSLLFVQILVSIVLLIIFSLSFNSNNTFSKFLICGSIFVLLKANSYIRDIIGGVSTDFNAGISNLRTLIGR